MAYKLHLTELSCARSVQHLGQSKLPQGNLERAVIWIFGYFRVAETSTEISIVTCTMTFFKQNFMTKVSKSESVGQITLNWHSHNWKKHQSFEAQQEVSCWATII